eukprot:TRINITY_DN22297_c0_g2_i2.p1 TRINITY_DN22297_c0_g2~~TRINITY_DN22297_c0_g2_i2.p1  ORF type:complete len:703 (-),score=168.74 TRINITY_DN22297_c0_g2_i2:508-2616(-)
MNDYSYPSRRPKQPRPQEEHMLTSTIAIVLVLGGLIFFHELGHFTVARLFGMGVKAFSLGFGPKLAGFTSGKTKYKISLIPLGGYVALAGEQGEEETDFRDDQLFSNRPSWQRLCVVAAGPFFNFLLAFLIYWFLILAQGQAVVLPVVGGVLPDSPAAAAGFVKDDHITAIDGNPIDTWSQMVASIRAAEGRPLTMDVNRDGQQLTLTVTPKVNTFKNLFGETVTVPMVGINQGGDFRYEQVAGTGIQAALETTWGMSKMVVKGFISILERLIPVENVGGPIMLAQMVHQSVQSGIFDLLAMMAIISINLAIINLLPIPVLDGGHILFFALEIIFRRPLNEKWKAMSMRIGLVVLLLLMSLAIFNDVRRLLSQARRREQTMSLQKTPPPTRLLLAMGGAEERLQLVLGQPGPNGYFLLTSRQWNVPGQSVRFLVPGLKKALDDFGVGMDVIEKIACVRGPGSFTGLRLVLAAAEGIRAGLDLPLAGLDYLPLLASGPAALLHGTLHVLTYARRGLVYLQSFDCPSGTELTPLASLSLQEAADRMTGLAANASLMGTGVRKNLSFFNNLVESTPGYTLLNEAFDNPAPEVLLAAAASADFAHAPVEPVYVRRTDAEDNLDEIAAKRGLDPEAARRRLKELRTQSNIQKHFFGYACGHAALHSCGSNQDQNAGSTGLDFSDRSGSPISVNRHLKRSRHIFALQL